ncbi:hypothetical protein CKM354_001046500 [Cercospora kikuchii]|uniref:Uncharacterized protein n=1 Tax=Cercospora kikuchii TaxID=84275 RepID=A0A9P3FJR4_9PEZI|nr:uncharacterized protein CKM354_001046500 [Cercospora kikuchii]GIZ47372.1 hypothetical protein CKM354_001046500 [Cercospora kikuchii]
MDRQVEVELALATAETYWKVASIFVFVLGIYIMWLCDSETPRPRRFVLTGLPEMAIATLGPVILGWIAYICLRVQFTNSELVPACRVTEYSKLSFNPTSWACNQERLSEWAATTAEEGLTTESLLSLLSIRIVGELVLCAGVLAIAALRDIRLLLVLLGGALVALQALGSA